MGQYHEALIAEITAFAQKCDQKLELDTIYFGGGTPSTYPSALLLDMLSILNKEFVIMPGAEVTIEVNPGTVNQEQLQIWKDIGINRLSIGVQSLKDAVLKKLNRHQSSQQVVQVLAMAKGLFDNVSVDFILGLPDVSDIDWKEMIEQVVTWPINHISVYFLTVHENTPLYFKIKQKTVELPCDDGIVDLYHWTREILAAHSFEQYEVSSFAKAAYKSRHNRVYWDRKPFKGFGIGAWSFDGQSRFENEKNLLTYLQLMKEGRDGVATSERLTSDQVRMEKVMLGIRQIKGVLLNDLVAGLSESGKEFFGENMRCLKEQGLITESDGYVVITPKGLSVENMIAQKLFS